MSRNVRRKSRSKQEQERDGTLDMESAIADAFLEQVSEEQVQTDLGELFRGAVKLTLELVLDDVVKQVVGAKKWERTLKRTDSQRELHPGAAHVPGLHPGPALDSDTPSGRHLNRDRGREWSGRPDPGRRCRAGWRGGRPRTGTCLLAQDAESTGLAARSEEAARRCSTTSALRIGSSTKPGSTPRSPPGSLDRRAREGARPRSVLAAPSASSRRSRIPTASLASRRSGRPVRAISGRGRPRSRG